MALTHQDEFSQQRHKMLHTPAAQREPALPVLVAQQDPWELLALLDRTTQLLSNLIFRMPAHSSVHPRAQTIAVQNEQLRAQTDTVNQQLQALKSQSAVVFMLDVLVNKGYCVETKNSRTARVSQSFSCVCLYLPRATPKRRQPTQSQPLLALCCAV